MDLSQVWEGFEVSNAVRADLDRIELLWKTAQDRFGSDGQWLFGAYSLVDVFYAPVAARITTYRLPVGVAAQAYVSAHLNDPAFKEWRAKA